MSYIEERNQLEINKPTCQCHSNKAVLSVHQELCGVTTTSAPWALGWWFRVLYSLDSKPGGLLLKRGSRQGSPAAGGQKVEVEYVQTFIAGCLHVGVACCSCEVVIKVHIPVNNKLQ